MPLPQGGGIPALPQFLEFLSIYVCTLCRRTTKFHAVTHMGFVLRGTATPQTQGPGPSAFYYSSDSFLFMRTPFNAELPNLTW